MDVAHPSNYGQARMWLNCDLTMCQYAGARASSIVPKGTAGTGVLETVGGWDFPAGMLLLSLVLGSHCLSCYALVIPLAILSLYFLLCSHCLLLCAMHLHYLFVVSLYLHTLTLTFGSQDGSKPFHVGQLHTDIAQTEGLPSSGLPQVLPMEARHLADQIKFASEPQPKGSMALTAEQLPCTTGLFKPSVSTIKVRVPYNTHAL